MSDAGDIELRFRWVSIATVAGFAAALTLGMLLHLFNPGGPFSVMFLEAGLVLLMAAPAVRIAIAVAERMRRGDWGFVLMTLVVALELGIVLWRASAAM